MEILFQNKKLDALQDHCEGVTCLRQVDGLT